MQKPSYCQEQSLGNVSPLVIGNKPGFAYQNRLIGIVFRVKIVGDVLPLFQCVIIRLVRLFHDGSGFRILNRGKIGVGVGVVKMNLLVPADPEGTAEYNVDTSGQQT